MLNREQELFLIKLGIDTLNEAYNGPTKSHGRKGMAPWNKGVKTGPRKTKRKGHNGHKWTKAQRDKFRATMKEKWAEKKRRE